MYTRFRDSGLSGEGREGPEVGDNDEEGGRGRGAWDGTGRRYSDNPQRYLLVIETTLVDVLSKVDPRGTRIPG